IENSPLVAPNRARIISTLCPDFDKLRQMDFCEKTALVDAPEGYSFSFLTGALYLSESVAVAELMRLYSDWNEVGRRAAEENLLRQRTTASRARLFREIRYRVEQFS